MVVPGAEFDELAREIVASCDGDAVESRLERAEQALDAAVLPRTAWLDHLKPDTEQCGARPTPG